MMTLLEGHQAKKTSGSTISFYTRLQLGIFKQRLRVGEEKIV